MSQRPYDPKLHRLQTTRSMCKADGTEIYTGLFTKPIWTLESDAFVKTDGNLVTPLLTGDEYFAELEATLRAAKRTIYILGWQINWDVLLVRNVRLYDVLFDALTKEPDLKVYILPWKHLAPMETFDIETLTIMRSLNARIGPADRVFARQAPVHADPSAGSSLFFAHHQKQVVVDESVAFVGGMDIAYGRRDGATYPLNASNRLGNDAYNNNICHQAISDEDNYVIPKHVRALYGQFPKPGPEACLIAERNLLKGCVQIPQLDTEDNRFKMIDPKCQPRMPWQDIQLKIAGPAVSDLTENFVLRWNVASEYADLQFSPPPTRIKKQGPCSVQLLRSASPSTVELEKKYTSAADRSRLHANSGHNHIYHAMVDLIEHAEQFIYIENQFFVSDYGFERSGILDESQVAPSAEVTSRTSQLNKHLSRAAGKGEDSSPSNLINKAIGNRIAATILDIGNPPPDGENSTFHVYMTLPVHAEGRLDDPVTMTQVHYTMQSITFGTQSLVNMVRRAIVARNWLEQKRSNHMDAFLDSNTAYTDVPLSACDPYLTILNLRNWEVIGDQPVTEQIYVHSKLLLVDDRYAIVGSANINDRSLLGDRDTELAVLVIDSTVEMVDTGSSEGFAITRNFARKLRMKLWSKLFGNLGNVRPAGLEEAISRPASRSSWEAISGLARRNSRIYEKIFPHIPADNRSIWPPILMDGQKRAGGLMPFDELFWKNPTKLSHQHRLEQLSSIRGFICAFPLLWTAGANNNSKMHSALFAEEQGHSPSQHAAQS